MAFQASVQSSLWFDLDDQSRSDSRLKRMLAWSLALHAVVMVAAVGLRFPQQGERPLASVEVSLVSLPTSVRQTEPAKPAEPVKVSAPKPLPAPQPKSAEAVAVPSATPPRGEFKRDILRDLPLLPDAPKFGDLSPAYSTGQPQQTAKIKSLDIPRIPDVERDPVVKAPQPTETAEDLNRELAEELKKIKPLQPTAKLDIPVEVRARNLPAKPVTQQEVKATSLKAPEMTLKVSGVSGANSYWARVQSIISSHWEPPPVDLAGQTYTVVIKFRLQRDGGIKGVVVQQPSGNAYFDMAGQRAVRQPRMLPAFPAEMSDSFKDVEMVFRVGEPIG